MTVDDTLDYIINNKCSVSRFGDGEFKLACGESIRFQKYDKDLADKLSCILKSKENNLLVCISDIFKHPKWMIKSSYKYTYNIVAVNRKKWIKKLDLNKLYGNAFISRLYFDWKDKNSCQNRFEKIKKIWDKKNIVIIEGFQSRLGYHNDLFSNVSSIGRILCPTKNAFASYEKILNETKKISKDILILIALGPSASVLAYDLSKLGYWVIDIGHIDIEYEWFKMKAKSKIKIDHKYTSEAEGGDIVSNDLDSQFIDQIISIIDC